RQGQAPESAPHCRVRQETSPQGIARAPVSPRSDPKPIAADNTDPIAISPAHLPTEPSGNSNSEHTAPSPPAKPSAESTKAVPETPRSGSRKLPQSKLPAWTSPPASHTETVQQNSQR